MALTQQRVKKGTILTIGIIFVSIILLAVFTVKGNQANNNVDKKLVEVDAAATNYINICSSTTNPIELGKCDANILSLYNNECVDNPGKLDVCKPNGLVETYLKSAGYL